MRSTQRLSVAEASDALQAISATQVRSQQLYGYQMASPHLILWGVIYVLGYGLPSLFPPLSWIWAVLVLPGLAASFWIAIRQQQARTLRRASHSGRYLAGMIAIFAFIVALFAIMQPRTDLQADAIMPLLVAIAYALDGIIRSGARMWITGLALGVLTVGGYFWLPQYFLAWMALTGGGALILGGVWLRTA